MNCLLVTQDGRMFFNGERIDEPNQQEQATEKKRNKHMPMEVCPECGQYGSHTSQCVRYN